MFKTVSQLRESACGGAVLLRNSNAELPANFAVKLPI
jgi:hypothetical protein